MTPTKWLEQETENASASEGIAQLHSHTLLVDETFGTVTLENGHYLLKNEHMDTLQPSNSILM